MIQCRWFLSIAALQAVALAVLVAGSAVPGEDDPRRGRLVEALMLTDLAVWTEARYTRHPSQADFFSAFQDGPGALEHFPAGMWVSPPDFLQAEIITPADRENDGGTR